ncbi:DUF7577 domain-containing protein [Halobacteriaceae archaeon SHR40]|uniref:DUF7577 domain-containing protein n=1 Tax=Halovenus amylolytica TaxID=2500550 RepID=UPI000FE3FB81
MTGELYFLLVTVLLLAGLAVTIPVLVDIFREGRERRQQLQSGELEHYPESNEKEDGLQATLEDENDRNGTRNCSNCGAENSTDFIYCQDCAQRL